MLDSIYIKNYRNLKNLRIDSLGRVNLITGKNNTGKTTLLEAIGIYATKGDLSFIYQLLGERGEDIRQIGTSGNIISDNIQMLSSLFTDRIFNFGKESAIVIGDLKMSLFGIEEFAEKSVYFRFVNYFDEIKRDNQGILLGRKRIITDDYTDDIEKNISDYKIGFEIKDGLRSTILPLDDERSPFRKIGFQSTDYKDNLQLIKTFNIDRNINGRLWDNITLTEKEVHVIEALKIIEPFTERIAFKSDNSSSRERTTIIKLSNADTPVPLKSMGDGINRILTIILALVNADNGFLLIDEFENGLHHTVQEQLWKIIFNLSQKLNIQVFVTTHSEDCIAGFENVLNNPENSLEGKLIRLDNNNGVIKQVEFDAKDLKIATDNDIEIR